MNKSIHIIINIYQDPPAAIITGDAALDPNHILLSMSSLKAMHHWYPRRARI